MAGGVEDFRRLARDFNRAGARGLKSRLNAGLYRSARPAITAAKQSAATTLPQGGGKRRRVTRLRRTGTVDIGGRQYVRRRRVATRSTTENESLAKRVEQAKFTVKTRGGRNPGIRITATGKGKKKIDLNALDRGVVRHPLFGNRRHWYAQRVTPLWFTRPMEANSGNVLRELEQAVADIERDISGR